MSTLSATEEITFDQAKSVITRQRIPELSEQTGAGVVLLQGPPVIRQPSEGLFSAAPTPDLPSNFSVDAFNSALDRNLKASPAVKAVEAAPFHHERSICLVLADAIFRTMAEEYPMGSAHRNAPYDLMANSVSLRCIERVAERYNVDIQKLDEALNSVRFNAFVNRTFCLENPDTELLLSPGRPLFVVGAGDDLNTTSRQSASGIKIYNCCADTMSLCEASDSTNGNSQKVNKRPGYIPVYDHLAALIGPEFAAKILGVTHMDEPIKPFGEDSFAYGALINSRKLGIPLERMFLINPEAKNLDLEATLLGAYMQYLSSAARMYVVGGVGAFPGPAHVAYCEETRNGHAIYRASCLRLSEHTRLASGCDQAITVGTEDFLGADGLQFTFLEAEKARGLMEGFLYPFNHVNTIAITMLNPGCSRFHAPEAAVEDLRRNAALGYTSSKASDVIWY